jgi:short-subunit dehydrogenase
MSINETVVLIGGTNPLAKALVEAYLSKKNNYKILVTAKDKQKFNSLYSAKEFKAVEFFKMDVRDLEDIGRLIIHLKVNTVKISIFYLAAIKNNKSDAIEDLFQINFFSSVHIYDALLTHLLDFNYILVGSQGDLHGTVSTSSYNASKSAMSNYFEPIALRNKQVKKVFLIKPWLFKSKMIKQSNLIDLITCSTQYTARTIIKQIEKDNYLIYTPKVTYKLIQLLSFINKKFLYKILFKAIK